MAEDQARQVAVVGNPYSGALENRGRVARLVQELRQGGLEPVEMLGYVPFPTIGETPYHLTLAPYSFLWLELQAANTDARNPLFSRLFSRSSSHGRTGTPTGFGRAFSISRRSVDTSAARPRSPPKPSERTKSVRSSEASLGTTT